MSQQSLSSSDGEADATDDVQRVRDLFSRLCHYGTLTCTACFRLSPDERTGYDGFFQESITHAVNLEGSTLAERVGPRLCDGHREEWREYAPDATHLVDVSQHPTDDGHRKNAHEYDVEEIDAVESLTA